MTFEDQVRSTLDEETKEAILKYMRTLIQEEDYAQRAVDVAQERLESAQEKIKRLNDSDEAMVEKAKAHSKSRSIVLGEASPNVLRTSQLMNDLSSMT